AEDGIRDGHVTGVQTCALPISGRIEVDVGIDLGQGHPDQLFATVAEALAGMAIHVDDDAALVAQEERVGRVVRQYTEALFARSQIGRASCRERVESTKSAGAVR